MAKPVFQHTSLCIALAIAATPFALHAEGPAPQEPKVLATIEKSATVPAACTVVVEVRDPQSDALLVAPKLVVVAGEEANASGSDGARKTEVKVKANTGCSGGTYSVRVYDSGVVTLEKSGALNPKS